MNGKFGLAVSAVLFQQVWSIAIAKEFAFSRSAFRAFFCVLRPLPFMNASAMFTSRI
ncbi:MAG: hypothetical protein WCQ70_09295 [Lentimicrobiaceae bacterium]